MKKPMLALALGAASGLAGCSALPEQNLGAVTQRNSTATVFSYDAADNIGWSGSGAPTYINQIEDAIDLFTDGQGAFLAINPAGHVQGWFPNDGSVDSLRVEYGDAIESIDADGNPILIRVPKLIDVSGIEIDNATVRLANAQQLEQYVAQIRELTPAQIEQLRQQTAGLEVVGGLVESAIEIAFPLGLDLGGDE